MYNNPTKASKTVQSPVFHPYVNYGGSLPPHQVVVQRQIPPGAQQMMQQRIPMGYGPQVPSPRMIPMGHAPQIMQYTQGQQIMQQRVPMGYGTSCPSPHMMPPRISMGHVPSPHILHLPTTAGGIIDKVRLEDLVKQIDPNTNLEDNVKETLIEYCDDFVSDVINKVCSLANYRSSQQLQPKKKIEVRDVEMVLKMAYNMPSVPRAAVHIFGQPPTSYPKDGAQPTDAHKHRMMLIAKQLKKP